MRKPEPADELLMLMNEISDRCCCAGWMGGTEHALWKAVVDGPMRWCVGEITLTDVTELRRLSADANGWVIWNESKGMNEFVPMTTWLDLYVAPNEQSIAWEYEAMDTQAMDEPWTPRPWTRRNEEL